MCFFKRARVCAGLYTNPSAPQIMASPGEGHTLRKGWLFITYKKSLPILLLSDLLAEENKQNGTGK